jgi:hypothetical protein
MKEKLESIPCVDLEPFPNRLGNRGLPLAAECGFHHKAPLFTYYQK